MHSTDRKGLRREMSAQRDGIGAMTTAGVMGESILDILQPKIKNFSKKAFSVATLGIGPLVGKVRSFSGKARQNKKLYQDRLQKMVTEGVPEKQAKASLRSGGSDSMAGGGDPLAADQLFAGVRTANAVEKIANVIVDLATKLMGGSVGGIAPGPAGGNRLDRPTNFGEEEMGAIPLEEEEGDSAKGKSRNKLVRFARVSSKAFGQVMDISDKKSAARSMKNFGGLGKVVAGAARTMIMGIASAIGTVVAAIAPFLPIIAAVAMVVSAITAIAIKLKTGFDEEAETRKIEEKSAAMGKQAISDARKTSSLEETNTVNDLLSLEQAKITKAKKDGTKVKVNLKSAGGVNFSSMSAEDAQQVLDQHKSSLSQQELNMTGADMRDKMNMVKFNQSRSDVLTAGAAPTEGPMHHNDQQGFSDTELFTHELSRLQQLKKAGKEKVRTFSDGISIFDPHSVDNIIETDIDSAIAMAENHLESSRGKHIGMTREQIKRMQMQKGEGRMHNILNKSAEDMQGERSGFIDFAIDEVGKTGLLGVGGLAKGYLAPASQNVGTAMSMSSTLTEDDLEAAGLFVPKKASIQLSQEQRVIQSGGDEMAVARARVLDNKRRRRRRQHEKRMAEMTPDQRAAEEERLRNASMSGRNSAEGESPVVVAPVSNSNSTVVTNNTNVETGHMTGPAASTAEVGAASF